MISCFHSLTFKTLIRITKHINIYFNSRICYRSWFKFNLYSNSLTPKYSTHTSWYLLKSTYIVLFDYIPGTWPHHRRPVCRGWSWCWWGTGPCRTPGTGSTHASGPGPRPPSSACSYILFLILVFFPVKKEGKMSKSRIFWPVPSRSSVAGFGSSATPGGPSPCWPGRSSSPCNIGGQIFFCHKLNIFSHKKLYWHFISSKYVECCGVMNGSLRHLTMPPRGSAS